LFFNSTIFLVQTASSTFTMTWAGEPFVNGAAYYPPGGSLWNMDVPINCTQPANQSIAAACSKLAVIPNWNQANDISLSDYLNRSSEASLNISKAASAIQNNWDILDVDSCKKQYIQCGMGAGLQKYRDVVVVIDFYLNKDFINGGIMDETTMVVSEWTLNDLFSNMTESDSAFWDQLVPASANNSLWYTSRCSMTQNFTNTGERFCTNDRAKFLGFQGFLGGQFGTGNSSEVSNTVAFDADNNSPGEWLFNFWDSYLLSTGDLEHQIPSGYSGIPAWMSVKYCLAEPVEAKCKLGVSNVILLVVTVCVLLKTIQCFIVLWSLVLRGDTYPLITPGDAVDSLLRDPDPTTEKMSTLELKDFQKTSSPGSDDQDENKATFLRGLFQKPGSSRILDGFSRPFPRQWEIGVGPTSLL
jgi:hypothetical protein